MKTLIDLVEEAIQTDEEPRGLSSDMLVVVYESANKEEQEQLDKAFICLCGWSLKKLINKLDKKDFAKNLRN